MANVMTYRAAKAREIAAALRVTRDAEQRAVLWGKAEEMDACELVEARLEQMGDGRRCPDCGGDSCVCE